MWQACPMLNVMRVGVLPVTWLLFAGFGVVFHSSDALAWGSAGHRITAAIAATQLTPAARRAVTQLLGDETLQEAAVYMDTHRDELAATWPQSARWHYDNRPACTRDGPFNCRNGACATAQIRHFRQLLADSRSSYSERRMALRVLVHLLGDLHQPLHMTDHNDRGGNDVQVRLYPGAERRRLHEVFDTALIKEAVHGQREDAFVNELLRRYQQRFMSWQQGDPERWAAETHELGVREVYGALPGFACERRQDRTVTLPRTYVQRAEEYLPEQLAKAGVRIAAVLNQSFK